MKIAKWIKNLPLVQNIVPLVSMVFIGFGLLMSFIIYTNNQNLTDLEKVIIQLAKESHKMEINSELMELARSRTRLTSKIIDIEDVFEQDEINMKLDVYASQFARLRTKFLELDLAEPEKIILDKQNSIVPIILPAQRKAVELAMSNDLNSKAKAQQILYEVVLPGQDEMINSFTDLIEYESKVIDDLSKKSQLSISTMNHNSYRLFEFSLFIIVLISFIVIIRIRKIQRDLLDYHNDLEKKVDKRTFELNQAMQLAKKSAIAKSQFLATMSHEIRTPMNGVLGMAQLLETTKLDKTQVNYVQSILSSGKLLLSIINDILDFSKLDENKLQLESICFDLKKLSTEVLKLLETKSNEKGLLLKLDYSGDVQKYFKGDPSRLSQILFNLIGNAIKFTEKGHVKLSVHCISFDSEYSKLRIEIEDTGLGIEKDKQDNLFQSFTQADSSTTRNFGGTGLGLAISKQLVSLMGGEIAVESQYGKGSIFFFIITLPVVNESEHDIQNDRENNSIIDKKFIGHVLLVEDVLMNQKIAEAMLKQMGLTCDVASDGGEAVEMWRKNAYDIIFMDCRMPNMDGYEATQIIRSEEPAHEHIPVLALTANATKEDTETCISSGMDEVILKPFQVSDLSSALSRWLNLANQ